MKERLFHTDLSATAGTVRPPPEASFADQIRQQLQRILGSEQFRDSLRLKRFLSFIVETTLAGKSERIKAYTIALEALDRGDDFDPQSDPIVRVEAGRLRQALARYYAEAGHHDPLAIELPRGTYVPIFHRRAVKSAVDTLGPAHSRGTAELSAPAADPKQNSTSAADRLGSASAYAVRRSRGHARIFTIAFAAIAVLAILQVLFDIDHPLVGGPNHGLVQRYLLASDATASQPQGNEGAPVIYVAPVTAVGDPFGEALSPGMIRQRFIDALALYDDVTVVTQEPQPRPAAAASAPETGATNSPIYRLSTTVRDYPDGSVMSVVLLTDTTDGTIAWSKTYQRPGKRDASRRGIVAPDLAQSLLGPFGVIEARERIKRAAANPMQDTYRCILDANFYLRSFNPSQYQPVHDCLLHASTKAPPEVTVFADLAFIYLRNYRFGISSRPGDRAMLDNASATAARAVEIKPNSAFAQYALQEVALASGDIARAKIAGDNSFRLNPSDSAIAFGHAELLILTGETAEGIALLKQTSATAPNSWIGYHVLMALGCYLQGDFATAGGQARQIANPFFPPGLVLDALAASKTGDRARAQQDIAMLDEFYPTWRKNIRSAVARFLPEPAMADRIAADFAEAAADSTQ